MHGLVSQRGSKIHDYADQLDSGVAGCMASGGVTGQHSLLEGRPMGGIWPQTRPIKGLTSSKQGRKVTRRDQAKER